MHYGLTRRVLGCQIFIQITKEACDTAKAAKWKLTHALFVEEKLNYVLENYCEFERELLDAATDNMLFHDTDWSKSANEVHTMNRRIVNLLASCRLYVDQVAHNVNQIHGDDSRQAPNTRGKKSEAYHATLGYRVLDVMRNCVQHRRFPVYAVTRSSKRIDNKRGSWYAGPKKLDHDFKS